MELLGHMTDQYASMTESPISTVNLEADTFNFSVYADMGGEQFLMNLSMKVDGDSMKGKLEIPDMGMLGTWEASKQN